MKTRQEPFLKLSTGNKRWFPEIADIPVLQKMYRITNFFFTESQYTDIPVIHVSLTPTAEARSTSRISKSAIEPVSDINYELVEAESIKTKRVGTWHDISTFQSTFHTRQVIVPSWDHLTAAITKFPMILQEKTKQY